MSDGLGVGEWVVLEITNSLKGSIKIQNANLSWGKFIQDGREVSPQEIDDIVIPAGSKRSVSSSGRSGSPSGTEGTIDLYDDTTEICTLYWNSPWGSPRNNFEVRDVNQGYIVTNGPWNPGPGPLGNIAIKVATNE
ncbi:Aegerolysin [Leucogyrophana mollusca]|uniref:Aegerolysin n=1 Tax=Leucogyrophana mollusca TaxID=85980 RepID=A0ACB8AXM0_9AGAM|nr:Aegerolysin [Leucogyrophana mollusca]